MYSGFAMAMSNVDMLELCKPELRQEFEKIWTNLIVCPKGSDNYFIMVKTPMNLKPEFESEAFVGLSSKLTFSRAVFSDESKVTHKGIQRRHIQNEPLLTGDHYFTVLLKKKANDKKVYCSGIKRSARSGDMITYAGEKKPLTNVNVKYAYCASGVHAIPLGLNTDFVKFNDFQCVPDDLNFDDICKGYL